MLKQLFVYSQYVLPHHLITRLVGRLAEARAPWLKNFLINKFIKIYNIDLRAARITEPEAYPTFNSFFIRELKPESRPITAALNSIACPADGRVAEMGRINKNLLVQVKKMYFDLETLLGGDQSLAQPFYDGQFSTIYLAPYNYHRFHMPITGKLIKTIYVPGRLFSVNSMTASIIPHLYSRNERLIAIFETAAGTMAVVIVGAMIVGGIKTVWMDEPIRGREIIIENFTRDLHINKGEELGYFNMGSTVILLFEKNRVEWSPAIHAGSVVEFGSNFGQIL